MSDLKRVFEYLEQSREEIIQIQRELTARVALGPENGGEGEHEKCAFVKELFESITPDDQEEIRAPDKRAKGGYRPNLIARWGLEKTKPSVWVLSHSDVVPPGDLGLWQSDPYRIEVDGDRIIGRGVEDNQHGFVSSYLALKAIFAVGSKPKNPVGLAVVADEETGSEHGLAYVVRNYGETFKESDLIVVPDGGNEEGTMIEVAEKSMLWIKFTVQGQQCHASTPEKGKNSLFGAARLIVALEELKSRFDVQDNLFSPPLSTFEPTKMEANVPNVNTIPGKDAFYMDCRILPEYDVDEILGASRKIAEKVASELELKIEIEVSHRQDAAKPTSSESPVVKALAKAIRRVMGKEAKVMGIGGGTVAAFFRNAGLPAAVWGTIPDTAHQPNEYCLIPNIIKDAKVFACLYMGSL